MSQQVLYDAVCSSCGKPTKVVFPPDGKRPVYCKSCRKKRPTLFNAGNRATKEIQRRPFQEKKEVDKTGLKEALAQALLQRKDVPEKEKANGTIEPGETVNF